MKENFKVEQVEFLKDECEQKPKLRTFIEFKQFNAMQLSQGGFLDLA